MCVRWARRWQSFVRGGSVAVYVFLYALGFLFNTLHLLSGTLSVVLYLAYTALMAWGIYLAMGTVGFLCAPIRPPAPSHPRPTLLYGGVVPSFLQSCCTCNRVTPALPL